MEWRFLDSDEFNGVYDIYAPEGDELIQDEEPLGTILSDEGLFILVVGVERIGSWETIAAAKSHTRDFFDNVWYPEALELEERRRRRLGG